MKISLYLRTIIKNEKNIFAMISKNKIKYLRSLEHKKIRRAEDVFVAEGPKVVNDLLRLTNAVQIIATKEWLANNKIDDAETPIVTGKQIGRAHV